MAGEQQLWHHERAAILFGTRARRSRQLHPTKQELNLFFKYYGEYVAKARPQGRTIVFGGSWTLKIPKK